MELYKKIYIHSEDDLPKEDGWYFIYSSSRGVDVLFYTNLQETRLNWLSKIDWYLQPIEQPLADQDLPSDEDIEIYLKKEQCLESGVWFRVCMQVAKWTRSYIKSNRK